MTGRILDFLSPSEENDRFYGVTIGTVTNTKDEEGLGRVKVKFPRISDTDESYWARVLTPMAGKERGIYFLPEVDDEVLVAFDQGDVNFPYILGGLWNGKDKPPETNDDGKNNKRLIKSRSGHTIILDDKDGEEKIEIVDKSKKNSIVVNTKENTITISADADITIKSSKGKLILSGKGIQLDSQADVEIKASQNMKIEAGAQLDIKGQMVNIN